MSDGQMRFAVDTGGTFTDLVVDTGSELRLFKALTTPDDPVVGVLDVLGVAAEALGRSLDGFLGSGALFIHGTTRAINALVTGTTARTAFLTTQGHRDILLFREGGRAEPFDFAVPYPEPLVPRRLTFEVPERMSASGRVHAPLDEEATVEVLRRVAAEDVEAIGVTLLWSIVNPAHELRVGELIEEHLGSIPYTLSHRLNPTLREYRRASSTCIDASLKPLMTGYFAGLEQRLADAGFRGRTLIVTSQGGALDATDISRAPIHSINSGPSMAPVAGRHYARAVSDAGTAIIADTGGTTFDVSLVRAGVIPRTRETWIGPQYEGHITGFPSVDVSSIGAGGGSVAWVDRGGMLHVGPQSAGSTPGPACYGRGGRLATVTDACVALGYVDPDYFLGGAMALDADAARAAIARDVAEPLGLAGEEAAAAVMGIATENMVHAIEDITVNQGIDPRDAVLVGGGGAAGLNLVAIAHRLRCAQVLIPETGAALSAAGALLSDLSTDFVATLVTSTDAFDFEGVNRLLADLTARCEAFGAGAGEGLAQDIEYFVEARYPRQNWELEVALRRGRFDDEEDVRALLRTFHATHEQVFAINEPTSAIEAVAWRARVRCALGGDQRGVAAPAGPGAETRPARRAYFPETGWIEATVVDLDRWPAGTSFAGPAIAESSFTTVVVPVGAAGTKTPDGTLTISLGAAG